MADTAVAITAGSGTNIDTRTESTNSNHRQVIVIGDPSTNAGVAPVDGTAGLKVDLGADNDVTVSSSALPSGASTAANQSTIIGHVDGIETLLTTIDGRVDTLETLIASTNTKLDTVITSVQLIDNVTQTTAAPTGGDTAWVVGIHPDSVNANGQTTMSASAPVVVASDQSAIPVNPVPATTGGLSIFRSIDLDEGTLEQVKGSAGQVYGMWVTNTATATRFVKFYNATSGTLGTGTPVITIGIPGNSSDDVSGLFGGAHGIAFSTGICVGAGTGVADNDTGAPGANDVIVNIFYK